MSCADDLVNKNGVVYPCGNAEQLADNMNALATLSETEFKRLGQRSLNIIPYYSYESILIALKNAARKDVLPELTNQLIN